MDSRKTEWEQSYGRHENFIFYPKEEVVKFLNRYVRKRIDVNKFIDILDFSKPVKALDFGCGIGRQTLLMNEFGIESYGIDLSSTAISKAKALAETLNFKEAVNRFKDYNGEKIPFDNGFFDISIAESVLDSMHFSLAQELFKELSRITSKVIFLSLISGDDKAFEGEEIVAGTHEGGTIQSYFSFSKINSLIHNSNFKIVHCNIIQEESVIGNFKNGRYSIVLKRIET